MPQRKTIRTVNTVMRVRGKVFYNDRRRRIDLKRPIRDLLPEGSVEYKMELGLSKEAILQRIEVLCEQGVLPVILYFESGGESSEMS